LSRAITIEEVEASTGPNERNGAAKHRYASAGSTPLEEQLRDVQKQADESTTLEEELAIALGEQIGPIRCVGVNWYIYSQNSGIWEQRDPEEFYPTALQILPAKSRRQRLAKDVLEHLEMRSQVARDSFCGASKFATTGSVLLAVTNGILEISPTGLRLLAPSPEQDFTIGLPVPYEPNASAPTFDRVLEESVPDEIERDLMIDVLATALIPDCRHEAALVVIGEAGTGKSTIARVLPIIFGAAAASLSMSDLCHPTGYKLSLLDRKMINISSELNALEMEDSGLFKQLISGERFTARPIYGRPFEMSATATFVFLANSLPRFKYGTDAEVRRLRFVRFSQKPARIDTTLKAKIEADAPGVFAKLVERAQQLIAGRPSVEQGEWGKQTAARFAVSNDPIGQFVKLQCTLGPDQSCQKQLLVSEVDEFKQEHGLSEKFTESHFFRQL
jgi:P4 family phage/plasmid primase-like protien